MIGISRQTDYAARLVLHLAALEPETQVSIAEISKLRLLPVAFVRRLVGSLVKAGVLLTARGSGGRHPSGTTRPPRSPCWMS